VEEEDAVLFEGDTVRLKVGGPTMTLLSVKPDRCCCIWFDDASRFVHGEFEPEVIEFVEPGQRLIPHSEAFWRRARAVALPASNSARSRASSPGRTRSTLQ
jgi:uncharacterized protein YodC (DUF2158 family)